MGRWLLVLTALMHAGTALSQEGGVDDMLGMTITIYETQDLQKLCFGFDGKLKKLKDGTEVCMMYFGVFKTDG